MVCSHQFPPDRPCLIFIIDEKRARYDRFGMTDFTAGGGMGGMGDVDLEEMLSHVFGMSGMGFSGMGPMPRGPGGRKQKGKDVVQQYEVSLEELYKGKTVKLASTRNVLCSLCKG